MPIAALQQDVNGSPLEVAPLATAAEESSVEAPFVSFSAPENSMEELDAAEEVKPKPAKDITVHLNDEELWKSFHKVGNEMIVTKPGR